MGITFRLGFTPYSFFSYAWFYITIWLNYHWTDLYESEYATWPNVSYVQSTAFEIEQDITYNLKSYIVAMFL